MPVKPIARTTERNVFAFIAIHRGRSVTRSSGSEQEQSKRRLARKPTGRRTPSRRGARWTPPFDGPSSHSPSCLAVGSDVTVCGAAPQLIHDLVKKGLLHFPIEKLIIPSESERNGL
ncbi:hypothetical protein K0M31_015636 [Melipona bicolor]|uniref:Uncharacterized protein n=1 Tax=Melipona bicolor TaxID=60889 RepID=A0AA40FEW7_9HYME|nr:hypothetical protein K0M31_015636 [Melipona bicolor]